MQTGNKSNEPNWKVIAIAAIAMATVVGFIVTPVDAYPWIGMGAAIGAMAIDEL